MQLYVFPRTDAGTVPKPCQHVSSNSSKSNGKNDNPHHWVIAALTLAVNDLLVGQHSA